MFFVEYPDYLSHAFEWQDAITVLIYTAAVGAAIRILVAGIQVRGL
jgi:hypothetical protein